MIRLGIDTGGTFTDLLRFDEHGIKVHKVRSTPDDPSRAIFQGIAELMADDAPSLIIHGSTVATNALLERKGARVALVTTAGFEDVLKIGRQARRELYNFQVRAPRLLIEEGMTFGIAERVAADGSVVAELAPESIIALIESLRAWNAESVAVCLLHSYANPVHELQIAGALEAAGFTVSASHAVLPEYREFERWSTTAVNAFVTPIMSAYLTRLEDGLHGTPLAIMQSNGGTVSASTAKRAAVQTVLSGPAGGVVGARAIAAASGYERIISFDMGGTSTDVSLVDGRIGTTMESVLDDLPVRLPMLEVHTVGAGGGSIVWVDAGGLLRVGPRSAGASPGPACYGVGDEFTVTDANVLLGRIDADYFLGGAMKLDVARARRVAKALASTLKMSVNALAEGAIRIANANMVRAIRTVSVERGFDPRGFALLAFGGAGGLHACEMAEMLDMTTVLVPEHAGVLSAMGMLLADVTKDYSATLLRRTTDMSHEELTERFEPLVRRAKRDLAQEGIVASEMAIECSLDMRYQGQSYEIVVPFGEGTDAFEDEFHRLHQAMYGYCNQNRATEIVHLRVRAVGRTLKPRLTRTDSTERPLPLPAAVRLARFDGKNVSTSFFHRDALAPGVHGHGPAVVAGGQATIVVPPSFNFRIDGVGTLVAERSPARKKRVADAG